MSQDCFDTALITAPWILEKPWGYVAAVTLGYGLLGWCAAPMGSKILGYDLDQRRTMLDMGVVGCLIIGVGKGILDLGYNSCMATWAAYNTTLVAYKSAIEARKTAVEHKENPNAEGIAGTPQPPEAKRVSQHPPVGDNIPQQPPISRSYAACQLFKMAVTKTAIITGFSTLGGMMGHAIFKPKDVTLSDTAASVATGASIVISGLIVSSLAIYYLWKTKCLSKTFDALDSCADAICCSDIPSQRARV